MMQVTYGQGFSVAARNVRIARLETAAYNAPQVDCPVRHHFAPGIYAREISIPGGTVVTGAVHKTDNLVVISMGRLRAVTDAGTQEFKAGDTFFCRAGMKNAVVTLEDSRWTNIFPNPLNETDPEKLIESLTYCKASELLGGADNKQLAANRIARDQADYRLFLTEFGLSQELAVKLVENQADQIAMPSMVDAVEFCDSPIHGKGLCAAKPLKARDLVGPARLDGKRTPLGRYLNHSTNPNIEYVPIENGDLLAYTLRDIATGEELTNCYRQAMRVNGAGFSPLKGNV